MTSICDISSVPKDVFYNIQKLKIYQLKYTKFLISDLKSDLLV